MDERERVAGDCAAPRVQQVHATAEVMSNGIGANRDPIAVAVQDDGGAVALLDHVAGNNRWESGRGHIVNRDSGPQHLPRIGYAT